MPRLILASASPRRRELLGLLRIPFEVIPSRYEEVVPEAYSRPAELARRLAVGKARDVASAYPDALVLGADTLVVLGRRLYGKPRDEEEACRMLHELSGQSHRVITGMALLFPAPAGAITSYAVQTRVRFRPLAREEIAAYVATGEPADKAGAYAIQGRGACLIEEIRGEYPNVVGLPLSRLVRELRQQGIPILGLPAAGGER